jgi:hypothetical protein
MSSREFTKQAVERQVQWHRQFSRDSVNPAPRSPSLLPAERWEENLWPGIRSTSADPLSSCLQTANGNRPRTEELRDLKSSWILCANLYFPFRHERELFLHFFRRHLAPDIAAVESVECCYADPVVCDPSKVLGEPAAYSGLQGPTLPDLGIHIRLQSGGKGLVLTDCMYAEPSFSECTGRRKTSGNPHPEACLNFSSLYPDLMELCWQMNWANDHRRNRRYWEQIHLSPHGEETLRQCPAAGGYQLFRMQALAEAFAWRRNKYERVFLGVAYDTRNRELVHSLQRIGVNDFTVDWEPLFEGKSTFRTWTHQQWVAWIREQDTTGRWRDWSDYVQARYDL